MGGERAIHGSDDHVLAVDERAVDVENNEIHVGAFPGLHLVVCALPANGRNSACLRPEKARRIAPAGP
ncbi:hypothetical protein IZ6_19090 [Terrihabitans soli]|uniref:Uncharacterized protein n=1 Tax=Terrihabitans soli TaxID=708113 RepID=A0A6S6QLA3_9HYPH|nr:hypothetical protein IZ6_19090 [Terrihabitans soli]